MAGARQWFVAIRRIFVRSSCKSISVLDQTNLIHNNPIEEAAAAAAANEKGSCSEEKEYVWRTKKVLTLEDNAAMKIQACFRGHLARRAFRALRSLVKLQALVRGVCVRRQARIAIHCMQAMVRLQIRVQARQLLGRSGDLELSQPL